MNQTNISYEFNYTVQLLEHAHVPTNLSREFSVAVV